MSNENVTPIKDTSATRIEELKATHGDVAVVRTLGVVYVFRPPNQAELDRWHDEVRESKGTLQAHRKLAVSCCVLPSVDAAMVLFDKKAMLATKVVDVLTDLAGADIEIEVSKS